MTYSRHVLPGATPGSTSTQWTVRRRTTAPKVENHPTRRFSVQWIDHSGNFDDLVKLAPAIPLFEDAFSAFGRGTLLPTMDGPVAVEDLLPGTLVDTTTGLAPLIWIGTMTVAPGSPAQEVSPLRMYRIAADAFGLGRPMPDLLLGPGARLLNRNPSVRETHGTDAVLEPIAPMVDGISVIEITPVSAIQTYHIGFMTHRTVIANGVEVESMHPGDLTPNGIEATVLARYLSMFPQIRQIADFGRLAFPRVGVKARESVFAA